MEKSPAEGAETPNTDGSDSLRETVGQFEHVLLTALREKYARYTNLTEEQADMIVRDNLVTRFNLRELLDSYEVNPLWPDERASKVFHYLFDLKLQLYYIAEVDLGVYNRLYHDPINKEPALAHSPRLLLIRLSLDQNLISKSRVLWERIMNLVYFLETGKDLETQKSKKKTFFRLVQDLPRWRWLIPYEDVLTKYDDAYRTPEIHKHSVLRAVLMESREIDPNELLSLTNRATEILDNISAVIEEGKPRSFSDLHLVDQDDIDPFYLETI